MKGRFEFFMGAKNSGLNVSNKSAFFIFVWVF